MFLGAGVLLLARGRQGCHYADTPGEPHDEAWAGEKSGVTNNSVQIHRRGFVRGRDSFSISLRCLGWAIKIQFIYGLANGH